VLTWLKRKRDNRRTARSLYGSIVTQSRQGALYADWGVPDTAEGRFEMLVLHLVLAMRRLSQAAGEDLQRTLTETFAVDIDDAMREMTVGDLAVPRHVKRAVAVLHDRHTHYGKGLDSADPGLLAGAVSTRLGGLKGSEGLDTAAICAYLREATLVLAATPVGKLFDGRIDWPHPGQPER
jgi:cytochrome b pre-mRNA-processing protein 3